MVLSDEFRGLNWRILMKGLMGIGRLEREGRLYGQNVLIKKGANIRFKFFVGFISFVVLSGCSTMRESLILGAGTGAVAGGIAAGQSSGDRGENTIKGAVIGGVVGGLASFLIHGALEKRDANVRRETLMNLEHYDVLGFEGLNPSPGSKRDGKCFTTQEVDGRIVSIPCDLVNGDETK